MTSLAWSSASLTASTTSSPLADGLFVIAGGAAGFQLGSCGHFFMAGGWSLWRGCMPKTCIDDASPRRQPWNMARPTGVSPVPMSSSLLSSLQLYPFTRRGHLSWKASAASRILAVLPIAALTS